MDDFSVLKKLAQDANEQFPALEDQWSMVCTPSVGLELLAEIDRLKASLSTPESVTAEPAADYDALRKQFLALRTLANSNARMVSHWRNQCGTETREALLVNAANVSAERDTNQMLSGALLAAEDERDQLKAELEKVKADRKACWEEFKVQGRQLDRIKAENEALQKLAVELRGAAKCYNLHHCKSEQHAIIEPCKVLARIDAAMSK